MKKYKAKRSRSDAGRPKKFHGKLLVDATESLHAVVTDQDRKSGIILDPRKCAAAHSIMRTHHPVDVHVHRCITIVEYGDHAVRYKTPQPVRDQLLRYDASEDKKFSVGTYKFLPPPPSLVKRRGIRHSEPDRAHGSNNNKRTKAKIIGEKGRPELQIK